jgi:hypothetical protein
MNKHRAYSVFIIAAIIALTSCNSSTSPSPNPSASPQVANISGDYAGTMDDKQSGSGAVTATLAQHGSSAGGAITDALTGGGTITAQMSLSISSSNALNGAIVVDYSDGTTCTFSTTGTYTNNGTTTAQITGSYTAVTNCSGDTGTYTLNQQCVDTVTSVDRRTMGFPATC